MSDDKERTLEINWVQAVAGALAAMSSAVLLSTVGVTGTIIGAAIGSIAATVGSAVYSHYLGLSRQRIAEAHAAAFFRVAQARTTLSGAAADVEQESQRAELEIEQAERELEQAESELLGAEAQPAVPWHDVLARIHWQRLLLAAAGIFVVAMLVILAFELITGRAVSTYTGGSDDRTRTSIPGWGGGGDGEAPVEDRPSRGEETPQPTPTATEPEPTAATTEPPVEESPTESVSVVPTPEATTPGEPSPSPEPSPGLVTTAE